MRIAMESRNVRLDIPPRENLRRVARAWLLFAASLLCAGAQAQGAPNYQGLWWAAPAGVESGWGINFAHQGDQVFATWYTYDTSGKAWWLSMLAPRTSPTGSAYAGTINVDHGPPFNNYVGAGVPIPVGSGTLTFADANNGSFAYTVNGVTQTKAITRFDLGTGPQPTCAYTCHDAQPRCGDQLPGPVVGRRRRRIGLGRQLRAPGRQRLRDLVHL